MYIDTRPRHRNSPRPAWKVATAYLQWLRGRRCAVEGGDCQGKVQAAHTPDPSSKGMGTKAADRNAIPLCEHHHGLQHLKGWAAIGLTLDKASAMARYYWDAWKGDKGGLA